MGIGKRIFIASYMHQWLPLNEKLHERNVIGSPLCPTCDEFQETQMHFITCKCYKTNHNVPIRKKILASVEKHNVHRYLQILLLGGLKASAEGGGTINTSGIPGYYMPLIQQQQELGWEQLWHARWSKR